MSSKVRKIDYYPDEYIAGVGGVLKADEQGVYWMVCTLIMSEGGAIEDNPRRVASLCGIRPADAKRIVGRLLSLGKLTLDNEGKLSQKRAQSEVERSANRIQSASENGAKGGRPAGKAEENQDTPKAGGSETEKLTTNYQLATEEKNSRRGAEAPVEDKPAGGEGTDPWSRVYAKARKLMGSTAGGQVTKLRDHFSGDLAKVDDVLEKTATKANQEERRAYVAGVLRKPKPDDFDPLKPKFTHDELYPPELYRGLR